MFPFIIPLLFPFYFIGVILGLGLNEEDEVTDKRSRLLIFIPYFNLLYVAYRLARRAIDYVKAGT